jgi:hypothetical protein
MARPGGEMATKAGGRAQMRASHADRDRVVEVLKTAFVEGRLAKDELDLRVGQVLAARTYADLGALTADLPAGLAGDRPPDPGREPGRVLPPASVRGAVWHMRLGAVLTLGVSATVVATLGGVRSAAAYDPTAPRWPIALLSHTVPVLATAAAGAGVWLWLAWANGRGYRWARVAFVALFGLLTAGLFFGFGEGGGEDAMTYTSPDLLATAVLWLVGLAATLLIFGQTASQYYRHRAATRAATRANRTGR